MTTATFDNAIEIAQSNEHGACCAWLAPKVQLLISDYGDTFTVWDYRPGARKSEHPATPAKAYRILTAARCVRLVGYAA